MANFIAFMGPKSVVPKGMCRKSNGQIPVFQIPSKSPLGICALCMSLNVGNPIPIPII